MDAVITSRAHHTYNLGLIEHRHLILGSLGTINRLGVAPDMLLENLSCP
jgi:hypothetical protein